MKKLLFIILTLILNTSFAQGVFMTSQDYRDDKVTYDSCKLRLNHFFDLDHMTVIYHKEKKFVCKCCVFGYRDKNKDDYRFYISNNVEYNIVHEYKIMRVSNTIVLYTADVPYYDGWRMHLITKKFFSYTLDSEIFMYEGNYPRLNHIP